jgi:hypothetical protein
MHAQISPRFPQPLSFLSTTCQAGACTQSTTPPHLSASGVNHSRLHRPCSGQGTGSSTSKLTPPLYPSDQMSTRSRSPASRVVPRRGHSPVKGHGCRLEGGEYAIKTFTKGLNKCGNKLAFNLSSIQNLNSSKVIARYITSSTMAITNIKCISSGARIRVTKA